jgi:alginate O-acetyltransferase complex protein AlgI
MAVVLPLLFGVRLPRNFLYPYLSRNPSEFWRRWHITLSLWLRDYLYIALGGNRQGSVRTAFNLMATMVLGGLWHGANWTFVAWGAYHGLLLIIDRAAQPVFTRMPPALYRLQTFLLVLFGWVLFRSQSFAMALHWLRMLFTPGRGELPPHATRMAILIALWLLLVRFVPEAWEFKFSTRRRWAIAYAAAFLVCYLFMNGAETVFLYYQF